MLNKPISTARKNCSIFQLVKSNNIKVDKHIYFVPARVPRYVSMIIQIKYDQCLFAHSYLYQHKNSVDSISTSF